MGIFVTTGWWVYHYAVEKRNEVTIKLYLPPDYAASVDKRGQVANEVQKLPYVKSFTYVSPDAAKKTLSPSAQAAIDALGFNPLPPAFYVKLTDPEQGLGDRGGGAQDPRRQELRHARPVRRATASASPTRC